MRAYTDMVTTIAVPIDNSDIIVSTSSASPSSSPFRFVKPRSPENPLHPGGGVVFGPKPRDWSIKNNRKEKHLATPSTARCHVENVFTTQVHAIVQVIKCK
ncbi:hypothetical protein MLD38_036147 [Melastoma candidum]|uniref:Uncharacterized protein n=1 Tax=Melastoma candidum TaxID=119954 RepID=A0ACB9LJH6_9MYRT|nr:hypothetical protein MLD38_036147 [Melastoma candidum]